MGLSATGGLNIAGLDWLGARVYDPASRGFLSTDPLPPVLGAGWDGNPYTYAGNNPLGMVDLTGLRPITDHDLKEFDSHAGSHWEYIVAGVAIVVGVALIATGVGGPLGVLVIGAASGALRSGGVNGKDGAGPETGGDPLARQRNQFPCHQCWASGCFSGKQRRHGKRDELPI